MNDVLKTISERYTCRGFDPAPLTKEQTDAIAKAALASPSAINLQPWHIIIITDKAFIDEMDKAGMEQLEKTDKAGYERVASRGGKIFYNAPCMVMIASDLSAYASMDCGIVSMSIALAAHSIGLGSCICGMAGIPLGGANGAEFKKRMGFPEGYDFGVAVLLGKPVVTKEPHELVYDNLHYLNG